MSFISNQRLDSNIEEKLYTYQLSKKDLIRLQKSCLYIAKTNCPKDTQNMMRNAIYSYKTNNGFVICWDERFAYYLPYVDKGINPWYPNGPKVKANKGFVDRSIALIWSYLYNNKSISRNYVEYNDHSVNTRQFEEANEKSISKTKLRPQFINMANNYLKGKTDMELSENGKKMMTQLYKSLKKSQGSIESEEFHYLSESELSSFTDFLEKKI